ncbi:MULTISPECIES: tyrosine-type recombinase/integrase [Yersinia]|uniref:tyrosine-type recombinase/integrase n=1 Tax=Yersinia TaxID=629 RepID=UPI0009B719D4|nr:MULTISPECIES: site-specific integrase [Yersinia]ARB86031.1 site-specific integrase [Yersinia sp. FDAARGOS_228]AVL35879.1 site-specific integrase [Yersinia intermedia]
MALKQRYGKWYCDFVRPNGERVRRCLGTADKKQAQELFDQLRADAWRVDKLGEIAEHTFDETCLRWLIEKEHKRSLDDDRTKIEFFLGHFSGMPISSITEDKIMKAVSRMPNRKHRQIWESKRDAALRKKKPIPGYVEKQVSPATRSQHLSFIRSLLRAAADEWKWLAKAPVIKTRKPQSKRIRWLTKDEALTLINCMPENFRPVVVFALATGLRRSNILDLEWSQIDMQRKVAWIHPENAKAGKAIGVALNDMSCKVLREQIGRHSRYVFVHTSAWHRADGTKTDEVRKMRVDDNTAWRTGLKRSGITDFRFHDLRHTWASWLVQAGVPLSALQEMGGWESIEMVRRYAHLSPNHLTEHARKIDEVMGINVTNLALLKKVVDN